MVAIAYAMGRDRSAIAWRPVVWGIALQWIAGVVLLLATATAHAQRGAEPLAAIDAWMAKRHGDGRG